ncbi:MAG: N-acetyl-gamma-glutamyl-phosphate reductase [Chloroflexi bacterium]|nr:N-acetyl-gamma-glutamyl-phosphate reductase [Chloroflexota bacterium]MCI0839043.1 N-acetyl-gamma-glutamyl-phosphate reductase [Chloroflexota bacterium]
MVKVGIINVTGYAGAELARLLYNHPEADVVSVTGRSEAGKKLADVFPHLASYDLTIEPELASGVDFVFSALPHAASAEACAPLVRAGLPVVDLSADFRLHDAAVYSEWYGGEHPAQDLLPDAVYGLPELHREAIKGAKLVANPGCYPEGAILALAPAVKAGIIGPEIIVDSKSGVSGAGRGLQQNLQLGEAGESVSAYGLDGHRHWPEIHQEMAAIWPGGVTPMITFTPHLIPMTRGILTTAYAPLVPGAVPDGDAGKAAVREVYEQFYSDEPFVRVAAKPPATKQTRGNNMCLVYPAVDVRTGRLVVVSVLDNLVKGAAGQAIQNMNLMLGMPETTALDMPAVYP